MPLRTGVSLLDRIETLQLRGSRDSVGDALATFARLPVNVRELTIHVNYS